VGDHILERLGARTSPQAATAPEPNGRRKEVISS
jgi:hypothetical protein